MSVKSEGPAVAGKVVVELTYSYAPEQGLFLFCVVSKVAKWARVYRKISQYTYLLLIFCFSYTSSLY